MPDLRELYLEMVTDHAKRPRNRGAVAGADHQAHGNNPLCGDKLRITLRLDGDRIEEVAFDGEGCAISTASADLMAETICGKTLDEARVLFRGFKDMVTGVQESTDLGKLAVFAGVREFPMRVKCATLAWHTMIAALEGRGEATTE